MLSVCCNLFCTTSPMLFFHLRKIWVSSLLRHPLLFLLVVFFLFFDDSEDKEEEEEKLLLFPPHHFLFSLSSTPLELPKTIFLRKSEKSLLRSLSIRDGRISRHCVRILNGFRESSLSLLHTSKACRLAKPPAS